MMVLKVEVPPDLVCGDVDEGFGAVADAFRHNFAAGREIGAACTFELDGRKVVDLWGGYRDGRRRLPWEADTLVPVFSATKGMAATAMAVAHSRGWFDLDAPVADHWPAFATNGKQDITLRQLLAHQAGLGVPSRKIDLALVADHDRLGALLAGQRPGWEPGTRHGYQAVTLGWYESQLLARVDPRGRTLGRFFADEVATPLGAAFHIGLPDEVADESLATIHGFTAPEMLLHLGEMPHTVLFGMLNPRSVLSRSMRALPDVVDPNALNRRETLRVEVPAYNGIGQSRAMARIYGALACGGAELGITPATLHELTRPADPPSGGPRDVALGIDGAYAMGFLRPIAGMRFGSSDRAFGHPGGGGSLGFADPDARVGYAYAANRLSFHMPVDPRELALRRAFYTAIGGRPQS